MFSAESNQEHWASFVLKKSEYTVVSTYFLIFSEYIIDTSIERAGYTIHLFEIYDMVSPNFYFEKNRSGQFCSISDSTNLYTLSFLENLKLTSANWNYKLCKGHIEHNTFIWNFIFLCNLINASLVVFLSHWSSFSIQVFFYAREFLICETKLVLQIHSELDERKKKISSNPNFLWFFYAEEFVSTILLGWNANGVGRMFPLLVCHAILIRAVFVTLHSYPLQVFSSPCKFVFMNSQRIEEIQVWV